MYGLQHGALIHTEQQAIKGPKITSVKPFKRENPRSNLYKIKKRETRNFVFVYCFVFVFFLHSVVSLFANEFKCSFDIFRLSFWD